MINLSELRDLVRAEANISGLREYDTLIDSILNQELVALTGKSKYQELLTDFLITSPADGTSIFSLPVDFQLFDSVTYSRPLSDPDYNLNLSPGSGRRNEWKTNILGYPQYYKRVIANLVIYPYSDFLSGETIDLAYYKKPSMILDTDQLPVPALEKTLIQFAIGRMLTMTDTKRAIIAKQTGTSAWQDVRSENAGN